MQVQVKIPAISVNLDQSGTQAEIDEQVRQAMESASNSIKNQIHDSIVKAQKHFIEQETRAAIRGQVYKFVEQSEIRRPISDRFNLMIYDEIKRSVKEMVHSAVMFHAACALKSMIQEKKLDMNMEPDEMLKEFYSRTEQALKS